MGYTTDFIGSLNITPEIKKEHKNYINAFSSTRRMKRNAEKALLFKDLKRLAVSLPIGVDGGFFVGNEEDFGQNRDESVMGDGNSPPLDQPGLWCQWIVNDNGELVWNEGEKFYKYIGWLQYLINNFFIPWGYIIDGSIEWHGEDFRDAGIITVVNNIVTFKTFEDTNQIHGSN